MGGHLPRPFLISGILQGEEELCLAKTLLENGPSPRSSPGVKALDNVNLKVEEGEIHALIGKRRGKINLMVYFRNLSGGQLLRRNLL